MSINLSILTYILNNVRLLDINGKKLGRFQVRDPFVLIFFFLIFVYILY